MMDSRTSVIPKDVEFLVVKGEDNRFMEHKALCSHFLKRGLRNIFNVALSFT